MIPWLDRLTGRVTMYRLVLLCLLAVLAESIVVALFGKIFYDPLAILVSAAVAVVATVVSNRLIALAFRVKPHTESSIVTGLILVFLFSPGLTGASLGALALAGVIASLSKYVLAIRRRHVFNPAALAAFVMSIAVPSQFPTWWVGAPWILPVVAVAAFVILYRTRHLALGILFVVIATATVALASASNGADASTAVQNALLSTPILFFVGFMLSEPLTLPPRRWQQLAEAVVVGVLFGLPFHFGPVFGTYELALVVGNLLAFAVGQRRGVRLAFVGKQQLTPTSWELTFEPRRPVSFAAGQYMELSLPHAKADVRGQRRVFSIASHSGDAGLVRFGLKTAERSSSFKTALLALEPGQEIAGTSVGGDFLLPRDESTPLLFVAGGIGITPFVSQLQHLRTTGDTRDVTLVYAVSNPAEAAYHDRLAGPGVRVLLVAPTPLSPMPDGWTYLGPGPVSGELLRSAVNDVSRRHAYVSGPPQLVEDVRRILRRAGVRKVTTDAFTGY
jgi:ferredoxin-NADP reductase